MNYYAADTFLSGGRKKSSRPIANNTRVERIDAETIGIRLHSTYVVKLHRDGSYELNSGGWHTMTTADRIRTYKPDDGLTVGGHRVGKAPSRWWVFRGWQQPLTPFFDGIHIKDGEVLNARPQDEIDRQTVEDLATAKAIRKYIDAYIEAAKQQIYVDASYQSEGAIACWDCSHQDMAGRTSADGDATAHLRRHVENMEFPPALFYNALRAKGAGPYYFQMYSLGSGDYIVDMSQMGDRWQTTQAKRWLRDFLNAQLFDRRPFVDYSARRAS